MRYSSISHINNCMSRYLIDYKTFWRFKIRRNFVQLESFFILLNLVCLFFPYCQLDIFSLSFDKFTNVLWNELTLITIAFDYYITSDLKKRGLKYIYFHIQSVFKELDIFLVVARSSTRSWRFLELSFRRNLPLYVASRINQAAPAVHKLVSGLSRAREKERKSLCTCSRFNPRTKSLPHYWRTRRIRRRPREGVRGILGIRHFFSPLRVSALFSAFSSRRMWTRR